MAAAMSDIFNTDFFASNRKRLLEATNASLIVLPANGLLQRSGDTTFSFRQESNFWYLTGVEEPDYTVVFSANESFLIAPKRSEHRDLWDGAVSEELLQSTSGIEAILEHHTGWLRLDKLLKKYKKVHTLAPAEVYYEHFGFYANPARGQLLHALKKHRSLEIVDIRKPLARLRQVKQTPELSVLKQAIAITVETLNDIRRNILKYTSEREIAADITAGFIRRGARGHAYQPIVASAEHAHTIHYVENNAPLKDGFLLMDVGAEVSNYSADISRTYCLGKPTSRQRAVYEATLAVHSYALSQLKPGINMRAYERAVDDFMAKELKKLKLLTDTKDHKKLKRYYPHLTSHFLGLDTHDAADYDQALPEGAVLTVEPGIYIPEEGIGVRIEDDVVITSNGVTILSNDLPRALDFAYN